MVMVGLLVIGCVWGTTNALIKRGAQIAEKREKERKEKQRTSSSSCPPSRSSSGPIALISSFAQEWFHLLAVWEYSVPFVVNLSASVLFIRALGDNPLNVAVPVTNATTFAATAVAGAALGEHIDVGKAMAGVAMIALGITLCLVPGIVM